VDRGAVLCQLISINWVKKEAAIATVRSIRGMLRHKERIEPEEMIHTSRTGASSFSGVFLGGYARALWRRAQEHSQFSPIASAPLARSGRNSHEPYKLTVRIPAGQETMLRHIAEVRDRVNAGTLVTSEAQAAEKNDLSLNALVR
jgi:hypothetical protein